MDTAPLILNCLTVPAVECSVLLGEPCQCIKMAGIRDNLDEFH
jgi:hypothetical protein